MRFSPRTVEQLLLAELVTLEPTVDGNLRLPPDDRSPNPNWRDAERNGDATGWGLGKPAATRGDSIYVTQVGDRPTSPGVPATGVLLEETYPPRRATLARQTADPSPTGTAYTVEAEVLPGTGPWAYGSARRPKPLPPEAVAIARTQIGFGAGSIGVAYGFGDEKKKMTQASPYAYGTVAEGQGLRVTLPDLSGVTAPFLYISVTDVGKTDKSGRVHKWVDLRGASPPFVDIPGPYKDDGKKPPDKNQTGVGKLPSPAVGNGRPGSQSRAWVHEENGPNNSGIQPGLYRFYLFVKTELGVSLWGAPSREINVTSERLGKVFRFYPPKNLPNGWEYGIGVQITPVANGAPAYYAVGLTRGGARSRYFKQDREAKEAVGIWGYPGDASPGKLEHRLYSTEVPDPNDPEADGTSITAPDAAPDTPYGYGIPQLIPGAYKTATAEAVEGEPSEGPMSDPSAKVTIITGQTLRIRPAPKLGVIQNAEGAERNRAGNPLEWTSVGIASPVTEAVEAGVFTYSTTTTIATAAFWSRTSPKYQLPLGVDTVLSVVGTIRASAHTAGASEAVLVEYNDAGGEIGTKAFTTQKGQPVQLAATGTRSLPDRGMRFGPGGTAFSADTTAVAYRFRAAPVVGVTNQTQWNQRASFENFQIFPYAEALRKFEERATDADDPVSPADPDNVSPAAPYPQQTTFGLGPARSVAGTTVQAEAPLDVISFETDFGAGNRWNAGWNAATPSGNGTDAVETTTPVNGAWSWRVQDASTGSVTQRGRSKVYTGAEVNGGALALRVLVRLEDLPNRGEVRLADIRDGGGNIIGLLRVTGTTLKLYRCNGSGTTLESRTVLTGLTDSGLLDAEIAVAGGGTKEGTLRCSAGVDAPRTAAQTFSGLDYSSRNPRETSVIVRETDSGAKWLFRYDQIVVTKGGDVLDRENPSVGAADLAPDPDAPPKTGGFRVLDAVGEKLNQWWGVIEPGMGFDSGIGWKTLRPIVVIPGSIYTQALQWRHLLLPLPDGVATNTDPVHQFFVTLSGKDKPDLQIGSPFGPGQDAALVSRVAGTRSGANTTPASGLGASSDWTTEDFWHHFTVPAGYTYASIGPKNDAPAIMVPQEHGFWKGALITQAARDAVRTYGAASTGTARVTLDQLLAADEFTPEILKAQRWVGFGASHSMPDQTALAWTARSTSSRPYSAWSAETANGTGVPNGEVVQIALTLNAVGNERPEVPAGSIFLETRPLAEPVLLDAFRQPFPGMVVASDAEAFSHAEENEEPVDNSARSIRTSKTVEKLMPMALVAFTSDAVRKLREITANTILYVEDPFGGETLGEGRVYKIRFYSRLDVETERMMPRRFGGYRRVVGFVSATPEAEVLESHVMGAVR